MGDNLVPNGLSMWVAGFLLQVETSKIIVHEAGEPNTRVSLWPAGHGGDVDPLAMQTEASASGRRTSRPQQNYVAARFDLCPMLARVRGSLKSSLVSLSRSETISLAVPDQAAWVQAALAFDTCVAIASIRAGDRQSNGSRPSSLRRDLIPPIASGLTPDSITEDTNAANPGAAEPAS
jgi:hypothetical protein